MLKSAFRFHFVPLIGVLLALPYSLFSQPATDRVIRLTQDRSVYHPGYHIEILEDPTGQLTLDDVRFTGAGDRFEPLGKATFNVQYTNSHYWMRFEIEKETDARYVFEIENPLIDEVEFFTPGPGGSYDRQLTGDNYRYEARAIKHRNLVLTIPDPPGGRGVYYFRLWTTSAFIMPLKIRELPQFQMKAHDGQYFHGLYYGIIMVMLLYNFFILLSTRDIAYFYYSIYIASFGLAQMSIAGFAFEYLWPESVWWNNHSIPTLLGISIVSGTLFAIVFLRSHENAPFMHKILIALIVIGAAQFVLGLIVIRPAYIMQQYTAVITALLTTTTAVIALIRGYKPARFFLIAWITFMSGAILFVLRNYELVPSSFLTQNGMQIGNAIEVTLISFALADKINTLRQEKEAAQQEALDNLRKADKIKDELLANTSHELRTPLNGIIGIAESLLDGAAGNMGDGARRNLGLIVSSGRRLSNLVNDILDFSRMQKREIGLRREPVNLHERVELAFALSRHLTRGKEIELRNEVPAQTSPLDADDNRLQQILLNLIGNAIKFTEQGVVSVSARGTGQQMEITVSDTGVGIPAEKFEDIFRSFEQADGAVDRMYGGTGLGLSITRQLIELHDGTIRVESTVGSGSRFIFTMPISDRAVEAGQEREETLSRVSFTEEHMPDLSAPEISGGTGEFHILVVDDEAINQQVITNHLATNGFAVTQAMSGLEALEKLSQDSFDLVLLDVMMPRMSGYETARRIRESYDAGALPVILLTARNQVQDLVEGFQAGANDYLTKPISKLELFTRINFHLKLTGMNAELKRLNNRITALLNDTRRMAEAREQIVALCFAAETVAGALGPGEDHEITAYLQRPSGEGYLKQQLMRNNARLVARGAPEGVDAEEGKQLGEIDRIRLQNGVLRVPVRQDTDNLAILQITEIDRRRFEAEREFVEGIAGSLRLVLENLQYVAQDRLAAIGRMAASIVHDLKNPMASIKGYAEMAGDEMFTEKERAEYLELIVREINRLSDMIYDILDFARGDELKLNLDNYAVKEYMNEVFRTLKPGMTEMDIKLECNLAFDGPVLMDGDRFRRVIYNIAGNAADAMEAGGKLIIDVAQEPGGVVFTFVDDGPGIPDEIQETLFEPFVTHGKSHGTGLGMAIVKKIVEQHGGQISYDSKRGQGTRFVVKLPSN